MAFCRRCHGTVNFKVNNISHDITEADVTIQPIAYMLEPKPNGHVTRKNTTVSVSATFQMPDELNVTDILTGCGKTVAIQECNGRTWVLEQAAPTFGEDAYNVTQGEVTIKWVGSRIREINPNAAAA